MSKIIVILSTSLLSVTATFAQNCTWGNCTPSQLQQEYQQKQLNQLQGMNNSLQQIQQQQPAPSLGQWSNTPQMQPVAPSPWATPPQTQQNCYKDAYGRIFCR